MRYFNLFTLFLTLLFVASSCTSSLEEDDAAAAPEYANLITGTYAYSTTEGGSTTGLGTAIVERLANDKIRIGLDDGVSFYAAELDKIDNDLIMEVPSQQVDYYVMEARFEGTADVLRSGSRYDGVYSGSSGNMEISLRISVNNQSDEVRLVLSR